MADRIRMSRITLAADACGYSRESIDLAVKLATALDAHLHGLFIEDTDLLKIADFPFTTEITLSTGQERKLDSHSVRRTLRIKGSEFRNRLALSAEKSRVVWSFDSVRGRKNLTELAVVEASGMTIVSYGLAGKRALRVRLDNERILLFLDHETNLLGILSLLMSLTAKPVIELTLAGTEQNRLELLRKTLMETRSDDIKIILTQRDENEILQGIKSAREHFDFVVASGNANSDGLQWILKNPMCPVILVA